MGKAANSEPKASPSYSKDEAYLQSVIPRRIALFESIKAQQLSHLQSIAGDSIKVTLPDGTVKEGEKWLSTPFDIAKEISKSLASNALISQVNGVLWDMFRPLECDCELKLFTFDTDEGRDTFWHSSAHILGQSVEMTYGCQLCIGPCTTRGEGFYYDAFYGELSLNEDHFEHIAAGAKKAVAEKQPFERIEVSRKQALDMFSENKFKVEIINDLPEDKTITVYRCGPLVDLCRGPHIPNTSFVKAFACLKASSAYWRGNKDRESLQRVYGISYPDQKRLKEYIAMLEEAKKYDHRELTKKQELFFFHPLSPGSCFFLPHGSRVCNKLLEFIRSQYWKRGYEEVWTPNMYNMQLWETSGHAANYKENMFVFEIEKQEFGLKPMNCPGHCLIFDHRVRSYRELPLRLADFGVLHRNEASGALTGLTRVRRFQQDDAHIFCRESQIKDEVKSVLEFINYTYDVFGFTFELKLSTRPEKYLGDLETWEKAEAALTEALNEFGKDWQINEGDGAFYGPKIDISVSDAMRRKFQCATLQLDFQLPSRFNLSYSAEDESKRERPVMIHRAILGSVERMFAILLEHYKGKWPFWLSPRQAIVCPVSDKSQSYALQVREQIHETGYYVDVDTSDRTIQKKVREAQVAQYNYILVVGEEEANTGKVSVRVRDKADHSVVDCLREQNIVPGIKVDKGLVPLPGSNNESWCQGLDGLASRSAEYYKQGARFAKWRTVVSIPCGPSALAVKEAAWGLARYAAISQDNGLVPIVEPEILLDGDHPIDRTLEVAEQVWAEVFYYLAENNVLFEGILLKPSMVTPGAEHKEKASPETIAKYTLTMLKRRVPPAVPGIMFLSGGQSEMEATLNLNAMNQTPNPWHVSFSYARALQNTVLKTWQGLPENVEAAKQSLLVRAEANSLAQLGKYSAEGEGDDAKKGMFVEGYTY